MRPECDNLMASRVIISWRDIPAQVLVREGRTAQKRELSERFIQAIDRAAMRAGLRESEAYLAEWRRGAALPCGDDLAAEADAAAAELEAAFTDERLAELVRGEGRA